MLGCEHDGVVNASKVAPLPPGSARRTFGSVRALLSCLRRGRTLRYSGESVTQWEHALQTAALALQAGTSVHLITAALLHDIGHLMAAESAAGAPTLQEVDDRHEQRGAHLVGELFGEAVTAPIRLHVVAKRFLVTTVPGYSDRLSEDSRRSLALQGGPMNPTEVDAFRKQRHADDALRLRCWDDIAKDGSAPPQRIERFLPAMHAALRQPSGSRDDLMTVWRAIETTPT